MLDIGWSEMAIVTVVALFVIGPRELPRMLRTVGRYAAKIRGMAREFQEGIDDAVREAELDDVKKQIESARRLDLGKSIEEAVDPDNQIGKAMDFSDAEGRKPKELDGAGAPVPRPAAAETPAAPAAETPAAPAPEPEPAPAPAPARAQGMAASVAAAAPRAAPAAAGSEAEPDEVQASRADA